METYYTKLLLSAGFLACIGVSAVAQAETQYRPCPFSCRSIGKANDPDCRDFRRGNTCFVETSGSQGSSGNGGSSGGSSSSGGQKICVGSDGTLRTRGQCRSAAGESELSAAGLPRLADTSIAGVPSGQTITGVVGSAVQSPGAGGWAALASFGGKPPTALSSGNVVIASNAELATACSGVAANCLSAEEVVNTASCTGSNTAPTAPAGKLCVYPVTVTNATALRAAPVPEGGSTHGFAVTWTAVAVGTSAFSGVWAYTAP